MAKRSHKIYWKTFAGGMLATLILISGYMIVWNKESKRLKKIWTEASHNKEGLPAWVYFYKQWKPGGIQEKILKTDLVYSTGTRVGGFFSFDLPNRNWKEPRIHDPLIVLSSFFTGQLKMDGDDKVQVLFASRGEHQDDTEALWSGNRLYTSQVDTKVDVWPDCHLAYTEKTITVNQEKISSWDNQQEALYTFYLPEGTVVSSLSLWVNGKEEKGILTTRGRADTAYKTIVGVEGRDPSVVHWKEGNTVLVRVFPVLAGESRKFKVGFSSPLIRENGQLVYRNIYFKGPPSDAAREKVVFQFEESATAPEVPSSFIAHGKHSYSREGKYDPEWSMQIADPGLTNCSFSFSGQRYFLSPYHRKLTVSNIEDVYLDVNNTWTKEEFDRVLSMAGSKNVFAWAGELVKIDKDNKQAIWEKLSDQYFSIFPFYIIKDAESSLVVSKGPASTLSLEDISKSSFYNDTRKFFSKGNSVKLFNLGEELSLYLRSLKEMRVLKYDEGSLEVLENRLSKNHFPEDIEDDNQVLINDADMIIASEATAIDTKQGGPDHLMRLFTYNHILQRLGRGLLSDLPIDDQLVEEARAAYVVTPVSSLLVLETQADYDRFKISDTDNSLGNAKAASNGAVPEPHEWALIVMVIITLIYVWKRKANYQFR